MSSAWQSVVVGLPVLLAQFGTTAVLLVAGIGVYVSLAPYREIELIRKGNLAAAIVLSGHTLALTVPLAAMMANSANLADIVLWGIIAILLQFLAIAAARLSIPHLGKLIEQGELAPALVLACSQIAVGILNAAAMSR